MCPYSNNFQRTYTHSSLKPSLWQYKKYWCKRTDQSSRPLAPQCIIYLLMFLSGQFILMTHVLQKQQHCHVLQTKTENIHSNYARMSHKFTYSISPLKRVNASQSNVALLTTARWCSDAFLLSSASFILCCCRLTRSFLYSASSRPCCRSRFLTSCSFSASSFWIWSCFWSYNVPMCCYNFLSRTITNVTKPQSIFVLMPLQLKSVLEFFQLKKI